MKKVLFLVTGLLVSICVHAQNGHGFVKNKYSTELNCEYAKGNGAEAYLKSQNDKIDLEKYRTVIRNGDISFIEKPYLDDMQLGVLSKTELKLFRNMFYAKKGYIFQDEDLTKFFNQFSWYEPKTKNIEFTELEQRAIDRIKNFEADSNIKYPFEGKTVVWNFWNGGANETAPKLELKSDDSFVYTPYQISAKVKKISGKWSLKAGKLVLKVESEDILLGGYVMEDMGSVFMNGTSATINYKEPLTVVLPLNECTAYKEYNLNWSKDWIRIGSWDCYIQ